MNDQLRSLIKNKNLLKDKKVIALIVVIVLIFGIGVSTYFIKENNYNNAISKANKSFSNEQYSDAKKEYETALSYKQDNLIEDKITLCNRLDESLKNFNKGIEYYNNKDYKNAYNTLKLVVKEDTKRYDEAQAKASESSKFYNDSEIAQANDSSSKSNYNDAINHINNILAIDPQNQQAVNLKNNIQTAINEKAKQEAAAKEQERINGLKNTIEVLGAYSGSPNSAGGVDLHIVWKNTSAKTIKYAYFEAVPYNAVNDAQKCEIRGTSNFRGKVTGPIASGQVYGNNVVWDCAWYNNTITHVRLVSIDIEYTDGTTASIKQDDIPNVQY